MTEAIRTALEALKDAESSLTEMDRDGRAWSCDQRALAKARTAIATLTAEMERPAPEPVAWMVYPAGDRMGGRSSGLWREKPTEERLTQIAENIGLPVVLAPLYAAPQKDQT